MTAPTSVLTSSGSPSRRALIRRLTAVTKSSRTGASTRTRDPAQHTWPWSTKTPATIPAAAASMSASAQTMLTAVPPSLSVSGLPDSAQALAISLPTSADPVNATL